jgi:hypothetical protein
VLSMPSSNDLYSPPSLSRGKLHCPCSH